MIQFKAGVDIKGIGQEITLGVIVLDAVFSAHGAKTFITACRDGKHMEKSKHYIGDALDIRLASRWVTTANIDLTVLNEARTALGEQFDLVLESDHFHLEFDPKADLSA